ncbi:MAG: hypothetical protein KAS36_09930 [Anaerolineales bacterium]|nr:hypothetical protein [Anaerolineales bacterium]
MTKEKREELRKWFRDTAEKIRTLRRRFKEHCKSGFKTDWTWRDSSEQWRLSTRFRHKHIAYCQLRGRERHQIEKPREDNLPNEDLIERFMDEFSAEPETVRSDQS